VCVERHGATRHGEDGQQRQVDAEAFKVSLCVGQPLRPFSAAGAGVALRSAAWCPVHALAESRVSRPYPERDDQRCLLQTVFDLLVSDTAWPTFDLVDRKLDRDFDLDAHEVRRGLPLELLYPPAEAVPNGSEELKLTIAGIAACSGSGEDVKTFLGATRRAAVIEREWMGPSTPEGPTLTAEDVVQHLALPAAGRAALVARLGLELVVEPWGWASARLRATAWSFGLTREVRRFRAVDSLDEYWEQREARGRSASTSPAATLGGRGVMGESKVFVSHAAADRDVAKLITEALVSGGVQRSRIFYSSARATGVPFGGDVRARLRSELDNAGLVLELLSGSFFTRPMCLIELGGAFRKSTYPIVIPPLTRSEAVAQIGEVHIGQLTTPEDIDEVFDELHDRLASDLAIDVGLSEWNPAIREFKERFPQLCSRSRISQKHDSPRQMMHRRSA
jgi:hypothetical protein